METPLRKVIRAFGSPAPVLSWLGLTAILAISGPFGTYTACPFSVRLVCFGTLVGIGIVWGVIWRVLMQHWLPAMGFWGASALVVGASAIVLPGPLIALAPVLTQMPPDQLPSFVEAAALVLVFGMGAVLVRWSITRQTNSDIRADDLPQDGQAAPPANIPRLVRRIDAGPGARILRLAARDHYVEVVTDRGTHTLLIRLTDAIAELDGVPGMRVHRSHWVADTAVRGVDVQGDRTLLVTQDGARVPIARPMIPEAEARGLLQRGMGSGIAAAPVRTAIAPGPKSPENAGSELAKPPV
jgi:hypothetical protein